MKDMKTMRIANDGLCTYVERQFFRRWWIRVSPKWTTNIQAYNWVRGKRNVELIKKK
jgi:hypothetical protein